MRNDANTPYPFGAPVVPRFDGTIMKMVVSQAPTFSFNNFYNYKTYQNNAAYIKVQQTYQTDYQATATDNVIKTANFPAFGPGQKVFYTLIETSSPNG